MKTVILRSRPTGATGGRPEDYREVLDTRYAERVIGNLQSDAGFCTACGPDCNRCRDGYDRRPGKDIAAIIDFPNTLPYIMEHPSRFVPADVPEHDVLLVLGIHEQILLEVAKACGRWGTKGVVIPQEAPHWCLAATRSEVDHMCEEQGVEVAFPKPFCAFSPPEGSVLAAFREHFHVGSPEVDLTVEEGTITEANVRISAACGATYCVARWLVGRRIDDNLEIEVISRRWHSFPCTASMHRDPELGGETPLHVAGQAHLAILAPHRRVAGLEADTVVSPLGRPVRKPVPPRENLERIQEAKESILKRLRDAGSISLRQLRESATANPAAVNSALLLLTQEGLIHVDGATLYPRLSE